MTKYIYLKKRILDNHILAISIGVVYFWFGVLNFFPDLSPAEDLAKNTMSLVTFNLISSDFLIILLAIWETLLELLLMMNIYNRPLLVLMLVHMAFTFTPLFLFSNQAFTNSLFAFTLLGQYIFKNIIIIGALLTLYKLQKKEVNPIT